MKWSVLIFFIFMSFNFCLAKLHLIQATIRHADRYQFEKGRIIISYPNDPYLNYSWATAGPMILTDKGKQNSLKMGQFLQEKYKEIIGSIYNKESVYIRALAQDRTIDTARLIAVGLFPSSHGGIHWNSSLESVSIPIDWEPENKDYLNYAEKICENYFIDRKNSNAQIQQVFSILSGVQKFYSYLSQYTGTIHYNAYQSYLLYGQLASEAGLGFELEPWTDSIFPNGKLLELTAIQYIVQTWTPRMKRLVGGVWIKNFLNHAEDLISGKNDQKKGYFYVYSKHHLGALLNALNIYEPHMPSSLSAVIFELHQINTEFYVKVVHKNEDVVKEVTINGCKTVLCRLDTFKTVLQDVILNDFEEDCGRHGTFKSR